MSTPLETSPALTPNSVRSRSTHGWETHSTWSGAMIERSWHSISDGEVNSSTWCTVRITCSIDALVAQRQRGVGRQAVLGVHDVVAAFGQQRPQAFGVGREHRLDALVERRVDRDVAHDPHGQRRLPEQAFAGASERHQLDRVAAPRERLGDLERVHDPAARLHRVGEHRDPHSARAGQPRGGGVGGGDDHAGVAQRLLLAAGDLRVAVGAAHAGDHGHPLGQQREGGRQAARRVGVGAVADHDVEQDAADVVGGRFEHPEPHLEVDHRVRAPLRVLLLAEVEDRVAVV